jgi:aminoglycoside phosphotransferase (APT) family kinase protein
VPPLVTAARTAEESRLVDRVEQVLGGPVTALEREPRWRKAWRATVEAPNGPVRLYLRGDKQLDAEPYPGLDREAAVLQALEAGGVPVPHVYGMCEDPIAIIMADVPGTRDVSLAVDDAQRERIAEQYIEHLAAVHRLDLTPFIEAGVLLPATAQSVALAYVDANEVLYRRTKAAPEPLVEWALRWARRHVPARRHHPAFILCDTGQFLFQDGVVTCLYDFEAAHIGDPLFDLASLRTRAGYEPLGADLEHMLRHYESITGDTVDGAALSYYTAIFMLTSVMALSGPLNNLRPEDMQAEYLTWDLMTRRALLWAMAEVMDVTLEPSPPPILPTDYHSRVTRVLAGTIERMAPSSPTDEANQAAALRLTRWAEALVADAGRTRQRDLAGASALVGRPLTDPDDAAAALEEFVLAAGPEQDAALLRYFATQTEDRVAEAVSIQDRLEGYALARVQL